MKWHTCRRMDADSVCTSAERRLCLGQSAAVADHDWNCSRSFIGSDGRKGIAMAEEEGNYLLLESFNIDDGQLDGLTPQTCFVLGYELSQVSRRAEADRTEWRIPIHAENQSRVATALVKRNRPHLITWMPNDLSEGWLELLVYESIKEGENE